MPGVAFVLSPYCFLSGNLKDVPPGTLVLICAAATALFMTVAMGTQVG